MVHSGRALSLLLVVLLPGCVNATHRARTLYVEGHLVEAAEVFEHSEYRLTSIDAKERVRYGLYRGATLLKLGDLDGASRWLYFAQQAAAHSPGAIDASDALTLQLAFKDLDRRRTLAKPHIDPLKGAVAVVADSHAITPDVVVPVEPAATASSPATGAPAMPQQRAPR